VFARRAQRFVLALALSAAMCPAFGRAASAEGVGVSPVRVDIDEHHRVQTIVITNHDAFNHVFQITTFRWSQAGSREIELPTDDLIVSPPIFTLIPESQQLVRIALRTPAPVATELTFRLLLRSAGADADDATHSLSGLSLRMQYSIPVFVASPQGESPKLDWSFRNSGPGAIEVSVANLGTAHVHIEGIGLRDDSGAVYEEAVARYVLAGNTVSFAVRTTHPLTGGNLAARVRFDTGSPQQVVVYRKP
jgi:fimbrial chaperone protein